MNVLPPLHPANTNEAKILLLETAYRIGIAEGKLFEESKKIREQIKLLKSQTGVLRSLNEVEKGSA